jgi:hypothetical protein
LILGEVNLFNRSANHQLSFGKQSFLLANLPSAIFFSVREFLKFWLRSKFIPKSNKYMNGRFKAKPICLSENLRRRVARLFLVQHTNNIQKNIPNGHKIYQIATKYTKCALNRPIGHNICQQRPLQDLRKFTRIGIFGLKKIPSGNPAPPHNAVDNATHRRQGELHTELATKGRFQKLFRTPILKKNFERDG